MATPHQNLSRLKRRFSSSSRPNSVNRHARISDNRRAGSGSPPGTLNQRDKKHREKKPSETKHSETTFGKLIPTEGPTIPGWPESQTARAVARQTSPFSQRLHPSQFAEGLITLGPREQ